MHISKCQILAPLRYATGAHGAVKEALLYICEHNLLLLYICEQNDDKRNDDERHHENAWRNYSLSCTITHYSQTTELFKLKVVYDIHVFAKHRGGLEKYKVIET